MLSVRCVCLLLALCSSLSLALDLKSITKEDGYVVYETVLTKRYKFFDDEELTLQESLNACTSEGFGARLALLESQKEADVLVDILSRVTSPDKTIFVFVGINEMALDHEWLKKVGKGLELSGYQPENEKDEACFGIRSDGKYTVLECSSRSAYVCEKS